MRNISLILTTTMMSTFFYLMIAINIFMQLHVLSAKQKKHMDCQYITSVLSKKKK